MRNALLLALVPAALALTACGHKKHARIAAPPAPATPRVTPPAGAPTVGDTETGIASWYGHPYHGRQAADGEIYDMETLVAAHRTLPFQTWVRVVNLRNNRAVEVRIIDRGPFIEGRIIDLSHAAARDIDLIGPGVGPVRIEVIRGPSSALATAPSATSANKAPARTASAPAASVTRAEVSNTSAAGSATPPFATPAAAPGTRAPASGTQAAASATLAAASLPAAVARVVPTPNTPAVETAIAGAFAVQVGVFFDRPSAERVRAGMAARYGSARIVRRDGDREMWRVLVGSEASEGAATAISDRIRQESGERNAFVVRLD